MKRNLILKLLKKYQPLEEEGDIKNTLIEFIKANSNCFDRELDYGHITGSSWLLNKTGDKALLLHHKKLDKWLQPGGHADGDGDVLAVAIKEAKEESGISDIESLQQDIFDIDIHLIPANTREKEHFHYDIRFLLQVKNDEEGQISEESKGMSLISKNEENLHNIDKSIKRMIKKWRTIEK
jgi:8-oxo-dGTP pyrophosphatase MutT (NUDIX family)